MDPERQVECREHGRRDATFVCQHLAAGRHLGFHTGHDEEHPDQLWPDAWCDACERMRVSENGWTDDSEAFARVQMVCDGCYQDARERNWDQDDDAFRALLGDAVAYLQGRQKALGDRYKLGSYNRYDWAQESGQLIFSSGGHAGVIATVQIAGSVATASGTWMWSWANASILEHVKTRVREVRAYGDRHRFLKLASACWTADETDGWEMAAIAAYLLGAAGAYRSPDENGFCFLVMTDVQWAQ